MAEDNENNNGTDNLILEHLRAFRTSQDRMEKRIDEIGTRVGHMDMKLASVKSDIAQLHTIAAEHSNSFDAISRRLKRIEKRLELVEV
ncbi:MAG: hypothetical protein JKX75_06335 [Gammaproteobacteria bacterium]|nr:hypothetical protein [Gammaproteobacteria bacterium]